MFPFTLSFQRMSKTVTIYPDICGKIVKSFVIFKVQHKLPILCIVCYYLCAVRVQFSDIYFVIKGKDILLLNDLYLTILIFLPTGYVYRRDNDFFF